MFDFFLETPVFVDMLVEGMREVGKIALHRRNYFVADIVKPVNVKAVLGLEVKTLMDKR